MHKPEKKVINGEAFRDIFPEQFTTLGEMVYYTQLIDGFWTDGKSHELWADAGLDTASGFVLRGNVDHKTHFLTAVISIDFTSVNAKSVTTVSMLRTPITTRPTINELKYKSFRLLCHEYIHLIQLWRGKAYKRQIGYLNTRTFLET